MTDVRPVSGASVPAAVRPLPAARAEAIKAAQRAFFNQALAGAAPAASSPTEPVAPVAAATRLSFDGPPPRAPLRPGSLLDIKV